MKKIFATVLIFSLIVELTSLSVTFRAPTLSFGDFSIRTSLPKREFSFKREQAVFAGKEINEFQSMVFVGDIMLARNVEYLMEKHGSTYPFEGLSLTKILPNSAVFGNFEASIPETHEATPAGSLTFSVKETAAEALSGAGFTHLSLGNNHSFDYGVDGYEFTHRALSKARITSFGSEYVADTDSVSYIKMNEDIVAIIGVNGLVSSESDVVSVIEYSKKKSNLQIVYIHWGEEYDLYHSKGQEKLAKEMVKAGADLIIGHHPHVTQGVGMIDGVPVFYSLGNYIFDQYFTADVQEGLVLALTYNKGFGIDILPVSSKESISQPNLMTSEEHIDFLASLARKSDESLREGIKIGRINLEDAVASSTKMAIISQ